MVFNATFVGNSYEVYAFIRATYPAGSVCTCSNGSVTLYAEDTSGSYAFGVPSAGVWQIACAGYTPRSVTVSAEGASYGIAIS